MALLGILFVAFRLHAYWIELDFSRITASSWGLIVGFTLINGAANVLLALAWWHLLQNLGTSTTRLGAIRIYGISQLARYIPSNIFHLVGRQALGLAAGISSKVLLKSIIWELGIIALAGSLSVWLIVPLLLPNFPTAASISLLLASAVLIVGLLKGMVGRHPVRSFIGHTLFLLISGSLFVALLNVITDGEWLAAGHWLTIGGAFILAWLVGLVTPGAPAGAGVREMVLLLLLKGLIPEAEVLMAVLLSRLVTVVGDVLFFVTASSISPKNYAFEKRLENSSTK